MYLLTQAKPMATKPMSRTAQNSDEDAIVANKPLRELFQSDRLASAQPRRFMSLVTGFFIKFIRDMRHLVAGKSPLVIVTHDTQRNIVYGTA